MSNEKQVQKCPVTLALVMTVKSASMCSSKSEREVLAKKMRLMGVGSSHLWRRLGRTVSCMRGSCRLSRE